MSAVPVINQNSRFLDLPPDIQRYTLSFLDFRDLQMEGGAFLASKGMKAAAEGSLSFRQDQMVVSYRNLSQYERRVARRLSNPEYCKILGFRITKSLTAEKAESLTRRYPRTTILEAAPQWYNSGCHQLPDSLFRNWSKLEDVNLHAIVTDEQVAALLNHCSELRSLRVLWELQGDFARNIGTCHKLRKLCLWNIGSVNELPGKVPGLEVLTLRTSAPEVDVSELIQSCPSLRTLDLGNINGSGDQVMLALGRECHQLEELQSRSRPLTDRAIEVLAKGCPKLRNLWIEALTNTAIRALAGSCRSLEVFNLYDSENVTDQEVLALANCVNLKEVHFSSSLITDLSICKLAQQCPKMREMSLTGCKVTDVAVAAIADNCRDIKGLHLFLCPITSAALQSLEKSPKLRFLFLSASDQISVSAIEKLKCKGVSVTSI